MGRRMVSVPRKIWARLVYIVLYVDMSFAELLMSVFYIIWAVVLLWLYPNAFAHTIYVGFKELANQTFWGLAFAIVGAFKLIGVLTTVRLLRGIGALLGVTIWVYTALAFHSDGSYPTLVGTYVAFALVCFLTFLRQARLQRDHVTERTHL